jgi:hypothetical protein
MRLHRRPEPTAASHPQPASYNRECSLPGDAVADPSRKSLGRRSWALAALLLAVLVPFARPSWAMVSLLASLNEGRLEDADARPILGPFPIAHGGHAVLERHALLKLPRMRIVAGSRFDEAAVRDTQAFMTRVLRLRRPFSVEWDPRAISWPQFSPAMMRAVQDWVEVHVQAWDTHVQAHAVIVANPIARSFARFLVKFFLPPQPVGIVAHEAAAHEFAISCCPKPRSYVKTSYAARDERYARSAPPTV